MKKLLFIGLLVCTALERISGNFTNYIKKNINSVSSAIELEESLSKELVSYEKLYNYVTSKHAFSKADIFRNKNPLQINLRSLSSGGIAPQSPNRIQIVHMPYKNPNQSNKQAKSASKPKNTAKPKSYESSTGSSDTSSSESSDSESDLETKKTTTKHKGNKKDKTTGVKAKSIYNPDYDGRDTSDGTSDSDVSDSTDNSDILSGSSYASEDDSESGTEDSDEEEESSDEDEEDSEETDGESDYSTATASESEKGSQNNCQTCSRWGCVTRCNDVDVQPTSENDVDSENSSEDTDTSDESDEESEGDFYFNDSDNELISLGIKDKIRTTRSLNIGSNISNSNESLTKLHIINLNATLEAPAYAPGYPLPYPKSIIDLFNEKIESLANHDLTEGNLRSSETKSAEVTTTHKPSWDSLHLNDEYTAEEINIKEVSWNQQFEINAPVTAWVSLKNKAAGRFQNTLTLVTALDNGFKITQQELIESISCMQMFEWWSEDEQCLQDILITAEDARVNWYHFSGDNQLEQLWTWDLQQPVSDVIVFQVNDTLKTLITYSSTTSDGQQDGSYVALFGIKPWKAWWLEQKFEGNGKPAVGENSLHIAIPLIRENTVSFYMYDHQKHSYILNDVIQSEGLRCLTTFSSGADSFLAVGADKSAIYQIKENTLKEITILDYNFNYVEAFLPLRVNYLRNDVILLVQHSLDHTTHSSIAVEALRWTGRNFRLMQHAPCISHGQEMHGFTCIVDAEGLGGIIGASSIKNKDETSILLPSEEHAPLMFDVKTEVVEIPDPFNAGLKNIIENIALLNEKFELQEKILDKLKNKLMAPRQLVGRKWKIHKLVAPVIRIEGDIASSMGPTGSVTMGGKTWLRPDYLATDDYNHLIRSNNDRIKHIIKSINNAVKLTDKPESINVPFVFNKGVTVIGDVFAENAEILKINNVSIEKVLHNAQPLGKDRKFHISNKEFNSLKVNKLFVHGTINGINIFNNSHKHVPLVINSDVSFDKTLNISEDVSLAEGGLVNNINLAKEVVRTDTDYFIPNTLVFESMEIVDKLEIKETMNKRIATREGLQKAHNKIDVNQNYTPLLYESAEFKSLEVGGHLIVKNINGKNWNDFQSRIVLKNVPNFLEYLNVSGKIVAKQNVTINRLNSLAYPDEYVSKFDTGPIIITAEKEFNNVLARKAYCDGNINGIQTNDIITLSTAQTLGNITFTDLAVTESLNIKGDILGRDLKPILSNPTLLDTTKITANVVFTNLQVNGPLLVQNTFNSTNIHNLKNEIFLKNDVAMVLDSVKEFEGSITVLKGLTVTTNHISHLNVDEFLTRNIKHNTKSNITLGSAVINKLIVKGSYAGTNFSKVIDNAIYASGANGDQHIHGHVIFDETAYTQVNELQEASEDSTLFVNNLIVSEKCNDWKVKDNVFVKDQSVYHMKSKKTTFKKLKAKNLLVHGSIETDNMVAGVDLREFEANRLSRTRDQVITAKYVIKNCTSYGNIDSEFINSYPSKDIIEAYNKVLNINSYIFKGNTPIDFLEVDSLITNGINSIYLSEVSEKAIYLNRESYASNITFIDSIEVSELEISGNFDNEYFPNFLNNVILKQDNPIVIYGSVRYTNPLVITEKLNCKYLNDLDVENHLLRKNEDTNVPQEVRVLGSVIIKNNLNVSGYYNEEYISNVNVKFYDDNKISILGNVHFEDGHEINRLRLNGLVNGKHNLEKIMSSLVWLNGSQEADIDVIFTKPVTIDSGLQVRFLYNNVNLQKLLDDIVYTNSDIELKGDLKFSEPVVFKGDLNITNELSSEVINEIHMNEWRENAIYKNRDEVLTGTQTFKKMTTEGNVNAIYLNDLALETLFRLDREYTIYNDISVVNLTVGKEITVSGLINSANVTEFYENSLMNYGSQIIRSPIIFQSEVHAREISKIGTLNGELFETIVPLNASQNLLGSYSFSGKVNAKNVQISGTVNGIDIDHWASNAIFSNNYGTPEITGNIAVKGTLILDKFDDNQILLNGENVTVLKQYLLEAKAKANEFKKYVQGRRKSGEEELLSLWKKDSQKYEIIKHFKEVQEIQKISKDDYFYNFIYVNEHQLILSSDQDICKTRIWKWNSVIGKFEHWLMVDTGRVARWNNLHIDNRTFLVGNVASNECNNSQSKIWEVTDKILKPTITLPHSYKLLSIDNNRVMKLKNELTGETKGYQLMNVDGDAALQEIQTNKVLNDMSDVNNLNLVIGKFNRKISVHILPSRIEIHSENGLLNRINALNPKNVHFINMNQYQYLLIFTDESKSISMYEYSGMSGFSYFDSIQIDAFTVQPLRLYDSKLGANKCYLLARSLLSVTLLQAVYN